ncbi:putative RNA binding protein Pym [Emericellopsis atlantica]|uniref:RNA binding protein Pym n=1 Tax=Emericellopsis atlantica TaxID=2614577 RepID=A0A9P7ZN88_9HYPO|nr:putative RNA binding protein Pym [Emericellopsis atlantica]KAG9255145.1 putative RNA binding protein Pym [Emericellopsis atlantica]
MPSEATKASNAGIVTAQTGERHIPESQRADGSTRKAIKIRPGYRPAEDVEVYKNRTAHAFQERQKRVGVPGTQGLKDDNSKAAEASSAASNKNAKRREARKKAKATEGEEGAAAGATKTEEQQTPVDPEVEKEKKARNLKKKLKQARDLQNKKEGGEALLPEQIAKLIKINELIRELEALGLDADGERNDKADKKEKGAEDEATGTK